MHYHETIGACPITCVIFMIVLVVICSISISTSLQASGGVDSWVTLA